MIVANCGGNGGGGALIPIIVVFFKFDPKKGIVLSNATIFLSGLIRYVINGDKRHPLKDGTTVLVDYSVATLMLPMIIVGAALGVMVNEMLSELIVSIIFCGVLTPIFIMTFVKFRNARRAETLKFEQVKEKAALAEKENIAAEVIEAKSDSDDTEELAAVHEDSEEE